jgi:hypothetical protein
MSIIEFFKDSWYLVPDVPEPIKTILIGGLGALITIILNGFSSARGHRIDGLKDLGVAQVLCFNFLDKSLKLKAQFVRDLKNKYDIMYAEYVPYRTGEKTGIFEAHFDFQTIPPINFPSDFLEKLICEKLSIGGEGVSAIISISTSIHELNLSIKYRTELCLEFQNARTDSDEQRLSKYLGLVNRDIVDDRFRSNINSLVESTGNCIFFSKHLEKLIVRFENSLRTRKAFFLLPGKKLILSNFKKAEDEDLMPDPEKYQEWTNSFIKRPSILSRLKIFFRL